MQRYDFFVNIRENWEVWIVKKNTYLCQLFLTDRNETKQHKNRLCVSKDCGLADVRIM